MKENKLFFVGRNLLLHMQLSLVLDSWSLEQLCESVQLCSLDQLCECVLLCAMAKLTVQS